MLNRKGITAFLTQGYIVVGSGVGAFLHKLQVSCIRQCPLLKGEAHSSQNAGSQAQCLPDLTREEHRSAVSFFFNVRLLRLCPGVLRHMRRVRFHFAFGRNANASILGPSADHKACSKSQVPKLSGLPAVLPCTSPRFSSAHLLPLRVLRERKMP